MFPLTITNKCRLNTTMAMLDDDLYYSVFSYIPITECTDLDNLLTIDPSNKLAFRVLRDYIKDIKITDIPNIKQILCAPRNKTTFDALVAMNLFDAASQMRTTSEEYDNATFALLAAKRDLEQGTNDYSHITFADPVSYKNIFRSKDSTPEERKIAGLAYLRSVGSSDTTILEELHTLGLGDKIYEKILYEWFSEFNYNDENIVRYLFNHHPDLIIDEAQYMLDHPEPIYGNNSLPIIIGNLELRDSLIELLQTSGFSQDFIDRLLAIDIDSDDGF